MTALQVLVLAVCLVGGAAVVGWPSGPARRLRSATSPLRVGGPAAAVRPRLPAGPVALIGRTRVLSARHPRRAIAAIAATAAVVGWMVAGPVAAGVAGGYASLGARAALRRMAERSRAVARSRTLDALCALAADLRAGLPPAGSGLRAAGPGTSGPGTSGLVGSGLVGSAGEAVIGRDPSDLRIGELIDAVWRLAERTGAPAAELVERIEADARAGDRARASAAAQAAGAKATALLLAGLPVGGLALGYGIGVDPLAVLLHTPLGASCAAGTVLLQAGGLVWADRLAGGPAR